MRHLTQLSGLYAAITGVPLITASDGIGLLSSHFSAVACLTQLRFAKLDKQLRRLGERRTL
jgi:hypothetical protein